jgi:hypothetical protein
VTGAALRAFDFLGSEFAKPPVVSGISQLPWALRETQMEYLAANMDRFAGVWLSSWTL